MEKNRQLTIRLKPADYEKLRALAYRRNCPSPSACALALILEALDEDAAGIAATQATRETSSAHTPVATPTVRVDEPAADDSDAAPEPTPASDAQKKKPAADDRQLTLFD